MRAIGSAFVVLVLAGSLAAQQQPPQLGAPTALDVRVESVQWHPRGDALLYSRTEDQGTGIGVHMPGKQEGRVLLHLGKNDSWEAQWFEGEPVVIVIVYRRFKGPREQLAEASVHLLDARTDAAKRVFTRAVPAKTGIDLDVDVSPAFVHAIFRVKEGEARYHLVLPRSGGSLIQSLDLDRAHQEGIRGPIWSIDGTANYVPGSEISSVLALESAYNNAVRIEAKVSLDNEKGALTDLIGSKLVWVRSEPPPPFGAPVLELMPSNAVLRSVPFRGPWEPIPSAKPLQSRPHPVYLQFGVSHGSAKSLWITNDEKETSIAALVSPHADRAWIAPQNRAIAYLTDGALFVRPIKG